MTSSTLIYLFRPSTQLQSQTPNPNIPATGSAHLHRIVASYSDSPTLRTLLPTFIPLVAVALAASHGHIVLKWIVENVAERLLWRGSKEEEEVQRLQEKRLPAARGGQGEKRRSYAVESVPGGFWNGGEEGAKELARVGKQD